MDSGFAYAHCVLLYSPCWSGIQQKNAGKQHLEGLGATMLKLSIIYLCLDLEPKPHCM